MGCGGWRGRRDGLDAARLFREETDAGTDRYELGNAIEIASLLRRSFGEGEAYDVNVSPEPIPESFRVIGYDVVSRDLSCTFACSPLSCNGLAQAVSVNTDCLLDTLDRAIEFAERCESEQPEPGSYYVIEVWRATP